MILTGSEIIKQVQKKRIIIEPFDEKNVTTNSYDFHLGDELIVYKDKILDAKKANATERIVIPDEGIVLEPDRLYLGHTQEVMGSKHYVPIIRGRSSTGRIGLFIHITADLIDVGSINQYTLMMHATQPVKVYKDMSIGQVTFWEISGEIDQLYNGKYQGLRGAQPSQVHRDFSST
jgi:dCTP deaminase